VLRLAHGEDDRLQVGLDLLMFLEDVLPAVIVEHDAATVRIDCLGDHASAVAST
jgi:hypothetical protein